jgi:transketolase
MSIELSVPEAYGQTLVEMGQENENIVILEADLMKASGTNIFQEKFPERTFQIGVAEQNMIGISAGLAVEGKIPFAATFAVFAAKRACDQVSVSVAYPKLNVKIIGTYCGLTVAYGATHQSVQDIAIMRAMPNMVVIAPADTIELSKAMREIAAYDGPVYLRTARGTMPRIYQDDYKFEIGKASILEDGRDVSIISTGVMTSKALKAAEILKSEGVNARVINISTIKPIDKQVIIDAAKETGLIVTVENHNVIGGLGSAVCEVVSRHCPVLVRRVGIDDKFGFTGSFEWSLKHFGFDVSDIVKKVKEGLSS